MLRRSQLRRYQVSGTALVKRIYATDPSQKLPGEILAFDLGSGKTATVLTAVRELIDEGVILRVLVVAPMLVAQTVWPDEIEGWEHLRALTWTLLRAEDDDPEVAAAEKAAFDEARALGMPPKKAQQDAGRVGTAMKEAVRARLANQDTELHIINKEGLGWLYKHFGNRWPYDMLILDDVREAKSGKKRTRGKDKNDPGELSRFGILSRVRKHFSGVVQMTGTPTPRGLQNMWGLTYLIDGGDRLGTARTAFEMRWFDTNRYSRKVTAKDHAFDEIMGRVKDVMFSLDPADLVELPPIVQNPIKVKLPSAALAEYARFKRELVSEVYDVEAVNAGVLHNKLLQFANGSMYQEDGNDIFIHDAKIEALERVVDEIDGAPLLVFYTYKFDLGRIRKKFPKAVVLNETNPRQTVRDWNERRIPLLLAHRESAGHGLNMQFGSNHMCEYGLTTDLELWSQARKRLQRPGATQTIFDHIIMAEGTIDDDVFPMYLSPKQEIQDAVLRAVRLSRANTS